MADITIRQDQSLPPDTRQRYKELSDGTFAQVFVHRNNNTGATKARLDRTDLSRYVDRLDGAHALARARR